MSNARFSIIPSKAVHDKELSNPAFKTLCALGLFGDENGWCYPSLSSLGEILDKSPQAVSKDIQELKERGYLNVYPYYDSKGARKSNDYQIKFDLPPQPVVDPPSTDQLIPPQPPEVEVNVPVNVPVNEHARTPKKLDILDGMQRFAKVAQAKSLDLALWNEEFWPVAIAFNRVFALPLPADMKTIRSWEMDFRTIRKNCNAQSVDIEEFFKKAKQVSDKEEWSVSRPGSLVNSISKILASFLAPPPSAAPVRINITQQRLERERLALQGKQP